MKWVRDPLLWLTGLFIILYLMPHGAVYRAYSAAASGIPAESFINLTGALLLVAVISAIAIASTGAGIATRPAGEFRPLSGPSPQRVQTSSAGGRWRLPCPANRFGQEPAIIAADFVRRVCPFCEDAGRDYGGACIGAERSRKEWG